MSAKDELWTHEFYRAIFLNVGPATISLPAFIQGLRKWEQGVNSDPGKRTFGKLERQANGAFEDADLVKMLQESTDDVAGMFTYDTALFLSLTGHLSRSFQCLQRPSDHRSCRNTRHGGRKVATLHEVQAFFQLKAHETFIEMNSDVNVATTLEAVYGDVDLVDLYPGVIAEQATLPDRTEHGLCALLPLYRRQCS